MRNIYQPVVLIALSLLHLFKGTPSQSASYRGLSAIFCKFMSFLSYFHLQYVPGRCGFRNWEHGGWWERSQGETESDRQGEPGGGWAQVPPYIEHLLWTLIEQLHILNTCFKHLLNTSIYWTLALGRMELILELTLRCHLQTISSLHFLIKICVKGKKKVKISNIKAAFWCLKLVYKRYLKTEENNLFYILQKSELLMPTSNF